MTITEADWMPDRYGAPVELDSNLVEHQVIGPPGCGKTTWLSRQCKVAAAKYGGEGVVVASLTRAAAAEVGGRDTGLPREAVGTLHAHAYRALERPAMAETAEGISEFNAQVGVGSYRVSMKAIADPENAPPEMRALDGEGDVLLSQLNTLRQRMTDERLWPPSVRAFAAEWNGWKEKSGYLDFTDLIEQGIEKVDQLPGKPYVLMIDEAQDMSALEVKWIRQLAEHGVEQLVIVGDPDQSLYTWRGAVPEAVFDAEHASTRRVLEQSYRVPAAVHERAVSWIEQMPGREPVAYLPRKDEAGAEVKGALREEPLFWQDPTPIIEAARRDMARGMSVMVLASCGYMLNPLVGKLRAEGEPFFNPYRINHGGWNPLNGATRLLSYLRPQVDVWGDEARFWDWNDVRRWTEPLQAKGVMTHGAKTFIKAKCQTSKFNEDEGAALADPATIMGLFTDENCLQPFESDLEWWETNLRHGERKTQSFPLEVARRHGAARLREKPRLMVGTIHSVKGGQADVVYLFPDLSGQGYYGGWTQQGEGRASILRQMYVGMTRAREELVLCRASGREAVTW